MVLERRKTKVGTGGEGSGVSPIRISGYAIAFTANARSRHSREVSCSHRLYSRPRPLSV